MRNKRVTHTHPTTHFVSARTSLQTMHNAFVANFLFHRLQTSAVKKTPCKATSQVLFLPSEDGLSQTAIGVLTSLSNDLHFYTYISDLLRYPVQQFGDVPCYMSHLITDDPESPTDSIDAVLERLCAGVVANDQAAAHNPCAPASVPTAPFVPPQPHRTHSTGSAQHPNAKKPRGGGRKRKISTSPVTDQAVPALDESTQQRPNQLPATS